MRLMYVLRMTIKPSKEATPANEHISSIAPGETQENAPRAFMDNGAATLKVCALVDCDVSFEPKRPWQNFCCTAHRRANDKIVQKEVRQLAKERVAARQREGNRG